MSQLFVVNLGRTRYAETWELQKRIFSARLRAETPHFGVQARLEQRIGDILLLTEHDPVFTFGKGADENHLLASEQELNEKKIDMFWIDRGGDVTFHGPGQIVGYPIIDLNLHYNDIHRYLRDLEQVIIDVLNEYGIVGGREKEFTGVWVKHDKIAALGVKVSKWITMHGFALNVGTDLSFFNRIIPCGIFHKGVTSIENVAGNTIAIADVQHHIVNHFAKIFSFEVKHISTEELETMLRHNEAAVEEIQ